jgi:hypothetical protein
MLPRPFIAVLAITLGIPFLFLLAIVSAPSGVSASAFTTPLTIAVLSLFLVLMVFEIKRIADLPPDQH